MTWRPSLWQVALATGAALIAVYFLLPSESLAHSITYSVIGLVGALAVLYGIHLHRPADRLTWVFFALGTAFSMLADTLALVYDQVGWELPDPSLVDVLYLLAYPFLFVAVLRLGRQVSGRGTRERRTDAAIVTMGAFALCWRLLISSYAGDSSLTWLAKVTTAAYPIMDIGIVFVLASALLFGGARSAAHKIVALAMVVMLIGDIGYLLLELHGAYADGSAIDVTWLLNYVLVGVAALHPSMAAEPASVRSEPMGRAAWMPTVTISAAIPPGLLVVSGIALRRADIGVLGVTSLLLIGLILLRMDWMVGRLSGQAQELAEQAATLRKALAVRDDLEADLRHQAFHDSLTGLANRALLTDRLQHALSAAERNGGTVGLILCDLDGFKTVNDSLGHPAGDSLLITVADRLASAVRSGDTVARLGGDEFAVLMDQVVDPGDATAVAGRIVRLLHEQIRLEDHSLVVSASIGISLGAAGKSGQQLLAEADAAMYEAKSNGKNGFAMFEPSMRSRAVERLRLTNAFDGALEREEFYLEFQPQFALEDGRLEGFEALVRWHHPTLGTLSPLRFIPLAEETGFIVPLGRWVLERACAAAAGWPATADGALTMSVNLSPRQLVDPHLVADVAGALRRSGLAGEQLVIEITESSLVTDARRSVDALHKIKKMGVRVAVDDFGTGYSSLGQLRNFPIDILKIDKSFVDQLAGERNDGFGLVEAIIRLAHELDLSTVAEGIEDSAQRERLAQMGCWSGQGFLMSRPLSQRVAENVARRAASESDLAYLPTPENGLLETG